MHQHASRDPLHGITLEQLLTRLVERYGWPALGEQVRIKCFLHEPSIKSSLKFLRRTPWARQQVEALYLAWWSDFPAMTEPAPQKSASTSAPSENSPWANSRHVTKK